MKFRTELQIRPFARPIGYGDPLLLFGSCFADEMRERLRALKFRAAGNFTGPLFNPASVAALLRRTLNPAPYAAADLRCNADGLWFSFDANTLVSNPDPSEVLARLNGGLEAVRTLLPAAHTVVVTFGTAWVYRLRETGEVVANCHKQPQSLFVRERLSVAEIVAEWSQLLAGVLAGKQVVLTVSPVRHLGDGLDGNCLSKSTLRVAAAELEAHFDHVRYFPAYELLTDDLRDYRFYADDLVHPSRQAVTYIWEKFAQAALTAEAQRALPLVERLTATAAHRPLQPHSPAARTMRRQTLEAMRAAEKEFGVDFSAEIERMTTEDIGNFRTFVP